MAKVNSFLGKCATTTHVQNAGLPVVATWEISLPRPHTAGTGGDRGCPRRGSRETVGTGSGAVSKMAPARRRHLAHTSLCPLRPLQPRGAWQLCQELWWPLVNLHRRSRQAPRPCGPAFPQAMPPMSVRPGPAGWGPQRGTAGTQPGFPS